MKALRFVVLVVVMFIATAGFAQQVPTLVWERQFTFHQVTSAPFDVSSLPGGMLFVDGSSGDSSNGGFPRAALSGFSDQGQQLWVIRDSPNTTGAAKKLATLPADSAVVWYSAEYPNYERAWLTKVYQSGVTLWRIPVTGLMYIGDYTDTSFIGVSRGTSSILFVFNREGVVIRQFPLVETAEAVVTIKAKDDLVWIGSHYSGGVNSTLSYGLSLYRISSGERLWRREFVDVVRGFFAVNGAGVAFVCGTKIVNEMGGYLKFLRAKVPQDGSLEWSYEHFTKRTYQANRANWVNDVCVVQSGYSEQVVLSGAIQKSDTAATANLLAYAFGFKASNGDSIWTIIDSSPGVFSSNFLGTVSDGASWVMAKTTSLMSGVIGGTLLKFTAQPLSVREVDGLPETFRLHQNYPNPFNPSTTIRFELLARTPVRLTVYDLLGREVAVLVNETLESGGYETTWDASGMPSGTYFYRLTSGTFVQTKKMVLLK